MTEMQCFVNWTKRRSTSLCWVLSGDLLSPPTEKAPGNTTSRTDASQPPLPTPPLPAHPPLGRSGRAVTGKARQGPGPTQTSSQVPWVLCVPLQHTKPGQLGSLLSERPESKLDVYQVSRGLPWTPSLSPLRFQANPNSWQFHLPKMSQVHSSHLSLPPP
uniref:Uncharacterized protein n=1 Tax=Rousettus aegyptiacus TaxID=9407 RepID=A0A7J8JIS6_ROUAE|nr:hypothetical protein HJG63_010430 [Rousettus aegyptiacus]